LDRFEKNTRRQETCLAEIAVVAKWRKFAAKGTGTLIKTKKCIALTELPTLWTKTDTPSLRSFTLFEKLNFVIGS